MSTGTRGARVRFWILAALALAGVILAVVLNQWPTQPRPSASLATSTATPLPPYSASRYLNAGPDARYVGIAGCIECHPKNHKSYQLTAHSQAMADLDPAAEPPDGAFEHKPSGRSYRVYRHNGQLRQQEVVQAENGKTMARLDFPIRYVLGSGHFCRSYLIEVDGFLHESPITWYTTRKRWDMSPGYDAPEHFGFERRAGLHCIGCHAGRVDQEPASVRLNIHEKSIGCESCHGPGSVHVALHRKEKREAGEEDLTIVNPGRLSRSLQEAVCAACHASGPASIPLRGRDVASFRPGQPVTDFHIVYRFDEDSDQMAVVGHFEQMRRSACWQKSGTLSCTTCHDPHLNELPKEPVAFYRQKCLACHKPQSCTEKEEARRSTVPADNCMKCHMPRGDTDIPHLAFTHHRIGKHSAKPPTLAAAQSRVPNLVPLDDVSSIPALDQQRNLALAYLEVAKKGQYAQYQDAFRDRARPLLEKLHATGFRDGTTAAALAEIYFLKKDLSRALPLAQKALMDNDLAPEDRGTALVACVEYYVKAGQTEEALNCLQQLVRTRRFAEDWRLLGELYLQQFRPREALEAFKQALAIRPYRADVNNGLARTYRQLGDPANAREFAERARWLQEHGQQ